MIDERAKEDARAVSAHGDGVTLTELLEGVAASGRLLRSRRTDEPLLHDVTHDSREAGPGVLFACRPGARTDGHDHAPAAVAAGSPALLVERPLRLEVPQLQVASVAEALGPVAAAIHGHPSQRLRLCGITGTNGKTTTAFLLEAALAAAGERTGLVGTVQTRIAGAPVAAVRTTPEASDLQRLLHEMAEAGVGAAAMEVSSHGLALGRVRGTRFAAAVFTNLAQDHLDFHGDMQSYFAAKAALFTREYTDQAAVTVDDAAGERIAAQAEAAGLRVLRVSGRTGASADVRPLEAETGPSGSRLLAAVGARRVQVRTALAGDFNVTNTLAALAAAALLDVDLEAAARGIAAVPGVRGRMERVEAGQPFTVLVDYAHTPDSLARMLAAARRLADGRLVVVAGCGGDRDRGKRPEMGRVVAELTDHAVLTSDNPRSEDPWRILAEMAAGAEAVPGGRYETVVSRREGIRAALAAAGPGDVVVIAGKGHEAVQELAEETIPFDDRGVAAELLAELGWEAGS